eukprot:6196970-Pleurochrysis_carterae.AAC.3
MGRISEGKGCKSTDAHRQPCVGRRLRLLNVAKRESSLGRTPPRANAARAQHAQHTSWVSLFLSNRSHRIIPIGERMTLLPAFGSV